MPGTSGRRRLRREAHDRIYGVKRRGLNDGVHGFLTGIRAPTPHVASAAACRVARRVRAPTLPSAPLLPARFPASPSWLEVVRSNLLAEPGRRPPLSQGGGRIDTTLTMRTRSQLVATDGNGFRLFQPFSMPSHLRFVLPLVATAGLHKGSTFRCLYRLRSARRRRQRASSSTAPTRMSPSTIRTPQNEPAAASPPRAAR